MSASNRNIYDKYIKKIQIAGLLRQNFSLKDISALLEDDGERLLTILHALEPEAIENRVIEKPVTVSDADTAFSQEGYNIRERYGFIVLNEPA